jgi:hypothetical protein
MRTKIETEKSRKMEKSGFSKFCEETSLPGWPYLNYEMSKLWKLLWIIFLCIVVVVSVYVLVANTQQYFEAIIK